MTESHVVRLFYSDLTPLGQEKVQDAIECAWDFQPPDPMPFIRDEAPVVRFTITGERSDVEETP